MCSDCFTVRFFRPLPGGEQPSSIHPMSLLPSSPIEPPTLSPLYYLSAIYTHSHAQRWMMVIATTGRVFSHSASEQRNGVASGMGEGGDGVAPKSTKRLPGLSLPKDATRTALLHRGPTHKNNPLLYPQPEQEHISSILCRVCVVVAVPHLLACPYHTRALNCPIPMATRTRTETAIHLSIARPPIRVERRRIFLRLRTQTIALEWIRRKANMIKNQHTDGGGGGLRKDRSSIGNSSLKTVASCFPASSSTTG